MSQNKKQNLDELNKKIISCRQCPRLVAWREEVAIVKRRAYKDWDYWGKPVPGFGDIGGRILVVGLAPGAHGSNRTGRMFTGDASGDFLYPALFQNGFANQPIAVSKDDGMILNDIFISAVCRCVPPGNKPTADEIQNCLPYLVSEINLMKNLQVIVALGRIGYDNVLAVYADHFDLERKTISKKFIHAGKQKIGELGPWLISSYHPSRQNTNTGRLTKEMFDQVWAMAKSLLV